MGADKPTHASSPYSLPHPNAYQFIILLNHFVIFHTKDVETSSKLIKKIQRWQSATSFVCWNKTVDQTSWANLSLRKTKPLRQIKLKPWQHIIELRSDDVHSWMSSTGSAVVILTHTSIAGRWAGSGSDSSVPELSSYSGQTPVTSSSPPCSPLRLSITSHSSRKLHISNQQDNNDIPPDPGCVKMSSL